MPDPNLFGKLFLLEFFIDHIEIRNSSLIFGENNDGQLCVSFQFLFYPVTEICEEDFTPKTRVLAKTSKIVFKSGKSCLFSHNDPNINNLSAFDLKINVTQKLRKNEDESYKVPVGTAVVSLGGSFLKIMRNSVDNSDSPLFSIAQDDFVLKDELDNEIGTILAFVRLSCFGQLIITQFQQGTEQQYMFKGTDKVMLENGMDGDTRQIKEEVINNEIYDNVEDLNPPGDTPYAELFNYKEAGETGYPKSENNDNNLEGGIDKYGNVVKVDKDRNVVEVDKDEKKAVADDEEEDEDEYKEYGAEVNGNSIKIRVLKKKNKQRKGKKEDEGQQNVCLCECDFPSPPEITYPDCSQYLCECLPSQPIKEQPKCYSTRNS